MLQACTLLEAEFLSRLKDSLHPVTVMMLLDDCLIVENSYQQLSNILRKAVESTGHKPLLSPLPPLSDLQGALKELNLRIIENHTFTLLKDIHPDEYGYVGDVNEALKSLILRGRYHPSNTGPLYDTIHVSFCFDKCPFQQNGKALFLGHLEDQTKVKFSNERLVLPQRFKSHKDSLMILGYEMKEETHATYKVCSLPGFSLGCVLTLICLQRIMASIADAQNLHHGGHDVRSAVRDLKSALKDALQDLADAQPGSAMALQAAADVDELTTMIQEKYSAAYEAVRS